MVIMYGKHSSFDGDFCKLFHLAWCQFLLIKHTCVSVMVSFVASFE